MFNNLVMFDQHIAQNRLNTIVPDLATSWSWNEDGTALTFPLRQGVKWHDGKPFTAKDVKCTWDLLKGKRGSDKLRVNPRKSWYRNVDEVVTGGDYEVTFKLKRPQPSLVADARLGLVAGLPVPRPGGPDAAAPDRHRPVQVRRVQAQRTHRARPGTPNTGSRGGPIWTASSTRSSAARRPGILALGARKFDRTSPAFIALRC